MVDSVNDNKIASNSPIRDYISYLLKKVQQDKKVLSKTEQQVLRQLKNIIDKR